MTNSARPIHTTAVAYVLPVPAEFIERRKTFDRAFVYPSLTCTANQDLLLH